MGCSSIHTLTFGYSRVEEGKEEEEEEEEENKQARNPPPQKKEAVMKILLEVVGEVAVGIGAGGR